MAGLTRGGVYHYVGPFPTEAEARAAVAAFRAARAAAG
jgi:hypothetical protein